LAAEHRAQLAKEAKRMMELEDSVSSLEAELSEAKQVLINYAKKEEDLVERKLKLENANNELRTEVGVCLCFFFF
jgi:chromosome segregation ATPase